MVVLILFYTTIFMICALVYISHDRRTKIVFCHVSEGDATYIRSGSTDVLIDAGTGSLVNTCLGKHMPFYDRVIEYAIVTHVKKSQYDGFGRVLSRYTIQTFITSHPTSKVMSFQKLLTRLRAKQTSIISPHAPATIPIGDGYLNVLWPGSINSQIRTSDKLDSYSLEFVNNHGSALLLGYLPNFESVSGTNLFANTYTLVKFPEYGFITDTVEGLLASEDMPHVLITPRKRKAKKGLTDDLPKDPKLTILKERDDIVYRF